MPTVAPTSAQIATVEEVEAEAKSAESGEPVFPSTDVVLYVLSL
jgi:hypothetical protein